MDYKQAEAAQRAIDRCDARSRDMTLLLDAMRDVDERSPCGILRGGTLLHYAAANGRLRAVHALLNRGADREALDRDGRTPLMRACEPLDRGQNQDEPLLARRADAAQALLEGFEQAVSTARAVLMARELGAFAMASLIESATLGSCPAGPAAPARKRL